VSAKDVGPRLGRGLAALLGEEAIRPRSDGTGVRAVGVDLLDPNPFQPRARIRAESLDELVASVRSHGVLQPLLLRPHPAVPARFQIIAGERRWRAAQLAGLHEVPASVRALSDQDAAAAALVENLMREDLDPIEEAEGFSRMIRDFDYTQEVVATIIGKSRSHVANTLRLLTLPDGIQALVRAGELSAGHARALVGHPSPDVLAQRVIGAGLSVRQTEALVAREQTPHRTAPVADADKGADIEALERRLSEQLGLRVEISEGPKGGTLRIYYGNLDQLDGLLARLQNA
jgi:ParB family transcriptional regulator, chromosome partitioning protein